MSMLPHAGVRRFHRWVSAVFTATVIANFAARAVGHAPDWLTYAPLPPLALLMLSGLSLFWWTARKPERP